MDNIYRIKIDDLFYVKGIVFETNKATLEMELQIIPTWEKSEAGWYPEDRAQQYVNALNSQDNMRKAELQFTLERVEITYD